MKILGIVLPILLSSLTITHGKKKMGHSKGASLDSGASIPVYYDSSPSYDLQPASSDCDDPVAYKTVPGIIVPASSVSYSAVPASSVSYSAVPASPVRYSAVPAGGSMSSSKKGKKGSGLSYQDLLGSLGKGLSDSFDKKGKGNQGGGVSGTPVVLSANVQPVQYVVPVQPSYPQNDCYDSVPSVVPVSYKPVGPVNYGAVPIGPSISYQKPVPYKAVPTGSCVSCSSNVGSVAYEPVSVGPSISYPHNVGAVAYEPVSVGPSISYPHNVGAVAYEPVSVGPSISYPHNVGAVAYEPVSVGPSISYPHNVGPVAQGVPIGTPVSYQKSVGNVAYGAVPVGPSVSYQKSIGPVSIGHGGNYAPTYTPSYSGQHPSHNKFGLLAGKKNKPGHGGYYPPPPHTLPAYAPPSQGSYVIVPSGNSPQSYGHGYDC